MHSSETTSPAAKDFFASPERCYFRHFTPGAEDSVEQYFPFIRSNLSSYFSHLVTITLYHAFLNNGRVSERLALICEKTLKSMSTFAKWALDEPLLYSRVRFSKPKNKSLLGIFFLESDSIVILFTHSA